MTLLLVSNLDFAWGESAAAASGGDPIYAEYRYRYSYKFALALLALMMGL